MENNNEKVLLEVLSKKDGVIILGYADTKEPCVSIKTSNFEVTEDYMSMLVGQQSWMPTHLIQKPKFSEVGDTLDKYVNAKID